MNKPQRGGLLAAQLQYAAGMPRPSHRAVAPLDSPFGVHAQRVESGASLPVSTAVLVLKLKTPFAIAHGVSRTRSNVFVQVGTGVGEAACVPYRGDSPQAIVAYIQGLDWRGIGLGLRAQPFAIAQRIDSLPAAPHAARAAVDVALYDLWAQSLGRPLYQCLGLDCRRIPPSSVTIAQGSAREMAEGARRWQAPVLKLKLGADPALDEARVAAVANATDAQLRVDANGGWTVDAARYLLPRLRARGVQLVEQPLAPRDWAGLQSLATMADRPALYLDESIETTRDIVAAGSVVQGVVLKLAKAGGIAGCLRQIAVARAMGLRVMLSCMVESSVAVTAAAHLAPLADEIDLDGPQLIEGEPFRGVRWQSGRLSLGNEPGLGLTRDPGWRAAGPEAKEN